MNKFNKLSSKKYFIPINERGWWESDSSAGHYFDRKLSELLLDFVIQNEIKTVVDFGCGTAEYIKNISNLGGVHCEAYDGNPNTNTISKGFGRVLDLSNSFDLGKKFDCVISLEVGEHIPQVFENIYIENINKHCRKYLFLSWAVPNQPGEGHVNCRDNNYIIDKFIHNGYSFDYGKSIEVRSHVEIPWFRDTILIFEKNV